MVVTRVGRKLFRIVYTPKSGMYIFYLPQQFLNSIWVKCIRIPVFDFFYYIDSNDTSIFLSRWENPGIVKTHKFRSPR